MKDFCMTEVLFCMVYNDSVYVKGVSEMDNKLVEKIRRFMDMPVTAGIVITILYTIVVKIVQKLVGGWGVLDMVMDIILVISLIVIYIRYRKVFEDEIPDDPSAKTVLKGMIFVLPLMLHGLYGLVSSLRVMAVYGTEGITPMYVLSCTLKAVRAGVCEEIVLRGLFAGNMMRVNNKPKDILMNAMIPSVVFGLVHFSNLIAGAGLYATISQVLYATGIGFFLCIAYFRSGTVIPVIIAHAFFDLCSFISMAIETGVSNDVGVLADTSSAWEEVSSGLIVGAIYMAIGFFMYRKKKRAEICRIFRME